MGYRHNDSGSLRIFGDVARGESPRQALPGCSWLSCARAEFSAGHEVRVGRRIEGCENRGARVPKGARKLLDGEARAGIFSREYSHGRDSGVARAHLSGTCGARSAAFRKGLAGAFPSAIGGGEGIWVGPRDASARTGAV